ncbi:signal transduction histidine kinase [Cylindrospermum stagnale PCC 7417]|uniref:histidine kinase n=1 Tax=Cylindrospermum stagnale PCC 7417 TaxID=56107 RepID=K9WY74_9NOST|nr:HAMP domain-containing sensor histidine kinase [Cylindrospermum stagnale]AFZ24467.1 signal transduction histidine kinase [Cylindrospermum stagnale PCC 7417]
MDFSQLLAEKIDTILDKWVVAVRKDRRIESADDLSYGAIKDHIPNVLEAMVTVLSKTQGNDIQSIVTASWQHGAIRAIQGFDPEEIAREYHQLRIVIFDAIEADLLQGTPTEIIRAFRLINVVIDEAIARCFNSYVKERLRELEHLHSSLTLHNEELTRLINANREHLSHLAHDLKHPLSSIIGYSDLFLREQRKKIEGKETYANVEHIERVLRNGRHLLRLINDLLEISRFDTGKIKLELAPTDVCELINNVYQMLEPLAAGKSLQIVVDSVQPPKPFITDSFQLQQVVTNLVSNAIRYTESGTINIVFQVLDNDKCAIAVSDTGIGIAPEDQERIFEPYYRAKSYLPDSTGLGLAIVSRLVKLLQGEVKLVSQVGVGSTFTVILPLQLEINEG